MQDQGSSNDTEEQTNSISQNKNINKQNLIIYNYQNDKDIGPKSVELDQTTGEIHTFQSGNQNQVDQLHRNIHNGLFETFLPAGYPHTVAPAYLKFSIYSNMSAFLYTAMGFLSAQSLFVAIGSTMTQANVAAAAYTWVLKDGLGQLGGILFASRYGRNFDEDIKKWRFMAIFALNVAMYIEILTLSFPHHFLLLASLANVGKNICFLLASASRASINMQLSKNNNIGDISGKSVSQATASTLVGGAFGLWISKVIDITQVSQLYPIFIVLTGMNIAASYFSAKVIDEIYLNNQRAYLLFNEYFQNNYKFSSAAHINHIEVFYLPNLLNMKVCKFIKYGHSSVYSLLEDKKDKLYQQNLVNQLKQKDRKFIYHVEGLNSRFRTNFKGFFNNGRPYKIHINMKKEAENIDILKSYYFARLLDNQLNKDMSYNKNDSNTNNLYQKIYEAEQEYKQIDFSEFENQLKGQGWSLEYIYLDSKKNRYSVDIQGQSSINQQ
ncbi:UNKNOWN [Stylonychia lemnae]|uniref:Protein root UVB sensitive/RUS domain-containing protein n=1 Tax=Stylonychia lemnae TaxID=5949 RepID=A0A078APM5_STYLE|nr:UNKNOWN [Stylonychia lemnae]|eukprot:CDW83257.1 UNKNOWN [Stylonychia lemnae]